MMNSGTALFGDQWTRREILVFWVKVNGRLGAKEMTASLMTLATHTFCGVDPHKQCRGLLKHIGSKVMQDLKSSLPYALQLRCDP